MYLGFESVSESLVGTKRICSLMRQIWYSRFYVALYKIIGIADRLLYPHIFQTLEHLFPDNDTVSLIGRSRIIRAGKSVYQEKVIVCSQHSCLSFSHPFVLFLSLGRGNTVHHDIEFRNTVITCIVSCILYHISGTIVRLVPEIGYRVQRIGITFQLFGLIPTGLPGQNPAIHHIIFGRPVLYQSQIIFGRFQQSLTFGRNIQIVVAGRQRYNHADTSRPISYYIPHHLFFLEFHIKP